ncbi:MAG: hypothetical protein KIT84_24835 [Labilithrix sp.]|nr:hypothetical protein [Labilithrix sp.]
MLGFAAFAFVAACTGGVNLGATSGNLGAGAGQDAGGGGGSTPTGPYDIECTFYHRLTASSEFEEQKVKVRSDGTVAQTVDFPNGEFPYKLEVAFGPAADAASDSLLTITTPQSDVVQQYRVAKNERPSAPFFGDHGFTGLVYLQQEMQYTCGVAGAEARPSGGQAVPFDVACQVELRTTPGGAIEKSAILEVKSGGVQAFEEGDYKVIANMLDGEFEGRALVMDIFHGTKNPSHQLLQLDRNNTIVNQLAGTTFTGRFAYGTGPNKELSYACSSRDTGGLGPECDGNRPCAEGYTCAFMRSLEPSGPARCWRGDLCQNAGCPSQCNIAESYPVQVYCP